MESTAGSNSTSAVVRSSKLPFTIREYEFISLIGKGGFAEVFLVRHVRFGSTFVAKIMTVDPAEVNRMTHVFDSEVSALLSLNHPNIIKLYDSFKIGAQFYYILEYCPNGTLHDEIIENHGLSYPRFIYLASQIVSALSYCHKNGIAHRDIKPGNILLDNLMRAKISDFGLATQLKSGELCKNFSGSCEYSSPEIFLRKPHDPMKGDVWALGVVFAIMISGQSPWRCDSLGGLRQLAQNGNYKLGKNVPKDIADVISQMIVVDPDKRITMEKLAKNPLFKQNREYQIPKQMPHSVSFKWDLIERLNVNDSSDDIEDEEDVSTAKCFTPVRSVSSLLMSSHMMRKVSVRPTNAHNTLTFSNAEDVIFV